MKFTPMSVVLILKFVQVINILTCLFTIRKGLKSYKILTNNKILLMVPIASIFQITISEVLFNINPILKNNRVIYSQQINVVAYIIIEFLSISYFLYKIQLNDKIKKIFIFIVSLLLLIASIEIFVRFKNDKQIIIEYFSLIEGTSLLMYLFYEIIKNVKKYTINQLILNSDLIAITGIFLSILLMLPISVFQSFSLNNINTLYPYLFASNSVGYIIFFSFLSISFYVSRKSRNT